MILFTRVWTFVIPSLFLLGVSAGHVVAADAATAKQKQRRTARAAVANQAAIEGATKHLYKTIGDVQLHLWAFNPPGHQPTDQSPAIVFFFGGGWQGGTVTQFESQARYLASRGVVAMVADYRVASRHKTTPFECVQDGKSAIRWVRANAAKLGVDPQRIAAGGGSAGGHVAAATGTLTGLDDDGEDKSISSRPDALVLFNPVFDNGPDGYGFQRVGGEKRYREISPLHNIRPGAPPTIVFLGSKDNLIPVSTAEDYQQRMEKAGSKCELYIYDGHGHGFFNMRKGGYKVYAQTMLKTDRFLKSLGYVEGEPIIDPDKPPT